MSCGYNTYAPSDEVLGHRGNVAKLNVGCHFTGVQSVHAWLHDSRLGKIKGRCTIAVVGESTAFKMIAAHQAVLARLPWHLSSLD